MYQTRNYHSYVDQVKMRYKERYGVELPEALIDRILMIFLRNLIIAMKSGHDVRVHGVKFFFNKTFVKDCIEKKQNTSN